MPREHPQSDVTPMWINALFPDCAVTTEPLGAGSSVRLWNIPVALDPIDVAAGRWLTRKETWGWKPLVYLASSATSSPDSPQRPQEVAAEPAVVQLLRNAGWKAYWTRGQARWAQWIVANAPERRMVLNAIDARIRPHHMALAGNSKGLPDIIAWDRAGELYFLEYKGPKRSKPHLQDELTREQIAWFDTGISRGVLAEERCAIVSWVPTAEACALLKRQCDASLLSGGQLPDGA